MLPGSGKTCIAFDQGGLIFVAGIQSKMLRLYDLKTFESVGFCSSPLMDIMWYR